MKVSILGSGNVATILGRKIMAAGNTVLQVYSRSLHHAQILAEELHCYAVDDWNMITNDADVYLIALSDAAIGKAAEKIRYKKGLVLHTAGAISIKVLKNSSANYGVLYPLQSLAKDKADYETIPLLIDGNTAHALCLIEDFAASISKQVQKTNDDNRQKLHLAAVFVNNFTNHLYSLAAKYCEQEQVDFSLLQPIIKETALRLNDHDPRKVQTGPASRNDEKTIEKHLQLLASSPQLATIYKLMTRSIQI